MGFLANRYKVIATLGSGGCGQTYLAEDTHLPSNRKCVVKQLRPLTTTPGGRRIVQERFQREAAILERLSRTIDQVPALFAYFEEANEFYLVQEWIDGRNLLEAVESTGFYSEAAARGLLANLLSVLEYVHAQGIIHRDIKPENIMLRARDGMPFLIDFGAVKEVISTVVNSQGQATSSSVVIGSPGYMPIEQAAGKPVFASDLYSLALTIVFVLTGRNPQDMVDPLSGEVLWYQYARHVSPPFAKLLNTAIRTNTRERFQTAREMIDALQALNVGPGGTVVEQDQRVVTFPEPDRGTSPPRPPLTEPQPIPPPKPKPIPTRFTVVVVALVGFLLLAGLVSAGIAYKLYRDQQEAEAENRRKIAEADTARKKAEEDARRAEQERLDAERRREEEERKRKEELEKLKPKMQIENLWTEHGVFEGGLKGMRIHVKFTADNFQSVNCRATAYFSFKNGTKLKDFDGDYKTTDDQVAVGKSFTPKDVNAKYDDFTIFMPIEELHLGTGRFDLRYQVQIYKESGEVFVSSDFKEFVVE